MPYVDGFVIPIPKRKLAAYRRIARQAGKVWMECGALEYRECVGEDLPVKAGMGRSFLKLAGVKPGETVVFSWILYKSRTHRDRVNQKAMKDPRIAAMVNDSDNQFDMKRMAYGGFETIVDL